MKKILSVIILPSIGILLYFFDANHIPLFPCLFHKITGFYCPGCGISRSILALLHFQFYQAFRYNMLGFLFFPFLLFYFQYQLICWGFEKQDKLTSKISKQWLFVTIILVILYGILRNTTILNWLAPVKL